jgi:hypothetical protein
MQTVYRELSKEDYERIRALPKKEQNNALFPDGIPMAWEYGYGYYGHGFIEKDGKYYATFTIGNSCD